MISISRSFMFFSVQNAFLQSVFFFVCPTLIAIPVAGSLATYSAFDDASWAVLDNELSNDILGSDRQGLYNHFMEGCSVAAGSDADRICREDERNRLYMNSNQPAAVSMQIVPSC
jgi:hypothetical protein